ncbi:hypothetical protein BJX68DRAFT_54364 [Aspergillus pseudodeflectus]|uniref:Uncharacterized protein n=1 Tax=Aspergillus pseudodeflectus TaxID=176178 RepID=A0ABR4KK12_9EURO
MLGLHIFFDGDNMASPSFKDRLNPNVVNWIRVTNICRSSRREESNDCSDKSYSFWLAAETSWALSEPYTGLIATICDTTTLSLFAVFLFMKVPRQDSKRGNEKFVPAALPCQNDLNIRDTP